MAQGFSRYDFDEFTCPVALSLRIDFFRQPVFQRFKYAFGKLRVQVAHILARLFKELRGVQIAQGISWKVPYPSSAPVYVLQTPLGIVWGC